MIERPPATEIGVDFGTGIVFKKSVGHYWVEAVGQVVVCELSNRLRKQLVVFRVGENRLERANGRLLIVFAEVQHELEALPLLADKLALLRDVVIKAKHLVAANGLGESLDLDRGLLLGGHHVLYQRICLVTDEDAIDLGLGLQPRTRNRRRTCRTSATRQAP